MVLVGCEKERTRGELLAASSLTSVTSVDLRLAGLAGRASIGVMGEGRWVTDGDYGPGGMKFSRQAWTRVAHIPTASRLG